MKKITILGLAILAGLSLTLGAEARGQDHGPRPAFGDVDANGDGAVTPAEMRAFGDVRRGMMFDVADTDGDGFLTADELDAVRTARMIARMDGDGDGRISRAEMEPRAERRAGRDGGGRGFGRADADGNGTLSAAEWEAMGQRRGRD